MGFHFGWRGRQNCIFSSNLTHPPITMGSILKRHLDAAEGWQGRMATKLTFAGGTGVVVGSILAMLNNAPLVRHTAMSTASFVIVMGCFSALQETSRLLRGRDSTANSVLAGAGTGVFLFKLHGGHPVKGAAICAALGGAAHWAGKKVDLSHGVRGALISMDLLDDDTAHESSHGSAGTGTAEGPGHEVAQGGWFERLAPYLPIRKFTDEEWEEYKRDQEETQRKRIEAALEGGLPVMVERQQQQQQQQPDQQQDTPGSAGQDK